MMDFIFFLFFPRECVVRLTAVVVKNLVFVKENG